MPANGRTERKHTKRNRTRAIPQVDNGSSGADQGIPRPSPRLKAYDLDGSSMPDHVPAAERHLIEDARDQSQVSQDLQFLTLLC